jgi:hypothetical protein
VLGKNSDPGEYPKNVRVFNSYFESIANRAIDAYTGTTGITSIGNHYAECGNNFAGTGNPVSTIINYISAGNYSIGDTFDRNGSDNGVYKRVWFSNTKNLYLNSDAGLTVGTFTINPGEVVNLQDNILGALSTGIVLTNPCVFNYSISRNGRYRTGTIHFTNDGTGPEYQEIYTESKNSTGVTLDVNSSNVVTYKTTNTGYDATLKYNITNF